MRLPLLLSISLSAACAGAPPPPPPKTYQMQGPSYLTEAARQKIRASMVVHRTNMSGLFSSLLVLDKESANQFSAAIAAQPKLTQDASLPKDEQVPARVIELQTELHSRAQELLKIVNSPERVRSSELASGFAELARVCVTCHSEYLYPEQ